MEGVKLASNISGPLYQRVRGVEAIITANVANVWDQRF